MTTNWITSLPELQHFCLHEGHGYQWIISVHGDWKILIISLAIDKILHLIVSLSEWSIPKLCQKPLNFLVLSNPSSSQSNTHRLISLVCRKEGEERRALKYLISLFIYLFFHLIQSRLPYFLGRFSLLPKPFLSLGLRLLCVLQGSLYSGIFCDILFIFISLLSFGLPLHIKKKKKKRKQKKQNKKKQTAKQNKMARGAATA